MRNKSKWILIIATTLTILDATDSLGGKYNPVLSIGDKAPVWKDLPGVDDKKHSFQDFRSEVLVVVFTCNSCPYAVDYEDRIVDVVEKYSKETDGHESKKSETTVEDSQKNKASSRVQLVAINVNKIEEDLLPAMKKRAKEKKFHFPYLFDESQQTARDYGATFTPEFFVLNKEREVVYMGALDDSPDKKKVKRKHLIEAIDSTLANSKVEVAETVAIGCRVRLERRRRKRQPK